jgi:hypothetical protein
MTWSGPLERWTKRGLGAAARARAWGTVGVAKHVADAVDNLRYLLVRISTLVVATALLSHLAAPALGAGTIAGSASRGRRAYLAM